MTNLLQNLSLVKSAIYISEVQTLTPKYLLIVIELLAMIVCTVVISNWGWDTNSRFCPSTVTVVPPL